MAKANQYWPIFSPTTLNRPLIHTPQQCLGYTVEGVYVLSVIFHSSGNTHKHTLSNPLTHTGTQLFITKSVFHFGFKFAPHSLVCVFVFVWMPKKGKKGPERTVCGWGGGTCIEFMGFTCMMTALCRKAWWPDVCHVFLHYATLHTAPGMLPGFHRKAVA